VYLAFDHSLVQPLRRPVWRPGGGLRTAHRSSRACRAEGPTSTGRLHDLPPLWPHEMAVVVFWSAGTTFRLSSIAYLHLNHGVPTLGPCISSSLLVRRAFKVGYGECWGCTRSMWERSLYTGGLMAVTKPLKNAAHCLSHGDYMVEQRCASAPATLARPSRLATGPPLAADY
jgi:hypothetical protein